MGRGRPKKKVAMTPPASVRVFSSTPSSPKNTSTTGADVIKVTTGPVLETIAEEKLERVADEPPKPWVDIIKGNRLASNGSIIEYTAPMLVNGEMEVHIEEQDVASEKHFWENVLIMYAIGEELSMNAVRKFMNTTWNFVAMPELYYNEEGYFLIRFKSSEDKTAVFMRGPYTIHKKPVLLHDWNPKFTLHDDILRVLPIWVMFPQLPLIYWGERSMGKIASAIGKPLMTDECTSKKLRVSYARVLVEVDVTKELKKHITIRDPTGEKLIQQVDYEWEPPFCTPCKKVGHVCKQKIEKQKQVYVQKQVVTQQVVPKENVQTGNQNSKNPAENEEEWIPVRTASRNRGKEPISQIEVNCTNGFDPLNQGECSTPYPVP
ncbi:uncharacterized protein LOC131604428 [Vicia villosa]|uniref:uncharacterized protein LOC131604428 n=1 Tax=Vicia villosa TaxID=3911 RepID=UPI00273CE9E5|nr:uncharacterized protein LOC131604428 [Vicia villosa]